MEAGVFKALVEVEPASSQLPTAPERVVSRTYPAVPQRDDEDIELQALQHPRNNAMPLDTSTPIARHEEGDPEMSAPSTPAEPADAFEALPSFLDPPMNKFRVASCCMINLMGGLTDSAPGALIPYMETHYNIGYAVVSLIFIGNALGFIVAAPLVESIRLRLGRARALGLSQLCVMCGYIPIVCTAPFPVAVCSYFLIGFGSAISLAMNNVFCANLRGGTTILGAMHGSYGVGGTVAPLIATSLVSRVGAHFWSRYYLLTLGVSLFNAAFSVWSFWDYEKEAADHHRESSSASALAPSEGDDGATTTGGQPGEPAPAGTRQQLSAMFAAFRSRVVLLGALFIFAYQGAEVSISGWVISFLIATRDGDPSRVGYVTSGFWAGITLGRFALSPLGARLRGGERLFVYLATAGAAVFQLLVWLVPSVAGGAVSLAVVGLLLGPVYPCAAAVFARNLTRAQQVSGLGVISAFGSSGGAVAPFTTGLLAQAAGTFVLHPIAIGLFGVMVLTWYGQPSVRKRTE
ncbi:hypothetical protein DL771_005503 [Monosporascus sp. 5C6A]|nr:hypothetical protein DL771_005503 [Monosporascus sp. 5C6A]